MSPAKIIQQYLRDQEMVTSPTESSPVWPCFVASLPEDEFTETDAVCIYDTNPVLDGKIQSSGEQIVHPGIQIKVRSEDYATGWNKLTDICLLLDGTLRASVTIGSETASIKAASRFSGPTPIGNDPASIKQAVHFTANYTITIS